MNKLSTKQKNKPIKVLGKEIRPENFPTLYKMAQTNLQGLEEQVQSVADAWHEGSVVSALQALESDLAHG